MRGMARSLHDISHVDSSLDGGFDLTGVLSDLASSGAEMFVSAWFEAHGVLTLTSRSLASGVDDTVRDFLATEQAHVNAVTAFIEALEVRAGLDEDIWDSQLPARRPKPPVDPADRQVDLRSGSIRFEDPELTASIEFRLTD